MIKQLLVYTIFVLGSLVHSQDLQSFVNKANNKIKASDLKSAESILQYVLDIDPSFAPARIAFSEIWLRKGNLSKANEYATLAVRIDEDFRFWWENLNEIKVGMRNGQQYFQQNNYDKVFDEYEAISKKYPYFSQVHYLIGVAKYKQKNFKEAAKSFERALKIYPDYAKAKKALNNVIKRL